MADTMEFECPCCGCSLAFDPNLQKLKCPYCDTEFDTEDLKAYQSELNKEHEDKQEWTSGPSEEWEDAENMAVFCCSSCGGEVVGDQNTASISCPYCGSSIVVKSRLSGMLKPDLVIPFKLDKQAAKNALAGHLKGKRLLPKEFKSESHIEEVKGIYVPFWLFGCNAQASGRFKGTKVRFWSDSKYNYTETLHFRIFRDGNMDFAGVPVDGSSKIDDTLMESLEPFDLSEAVDFKTAYLAGYLADKYDMNSDACIERANQRIKNSAQSALASTIKGYATCLPEQLSVNFTGGHVKYALLPVWLLNSVYKGKTYTFAMNGQTGKFIGDLPMDKGAYWRWFFGVFAGGAAAAAIIMLLGGII